jgi:hypothetical protein
MNANSQRSTGRVIWIAAVGFATLLFSLRTFADVPATAPPSSELETYRAECGACHIAYPPRLLPAASWQAVMSDLEKHFGTDASLDAPTARSISEFLARYAGSDRHNTRDLSAVALRITQAQWFRHEHDEIAPSVWKRKSVGGPSNCTACHPDAAQGRFNEHTVRIPPE